MSPKPDLTATEIVECVRSMYGLDARHVSLMAERAHAEATAYHVDAREGSYFLKLTPDRREPSPLARHLADAGISQVLAPLRTRDGHLAAPLADLQASLYPFLEGNNAFRTPLNEDQWTELGKIVRATHDVTLPSSISDVMRKETYSDAWRVKTRRYLNKVPSDHPDDSVSRDLMGFLSANKAALTMLVEHAEQLVTAVRRKPLTEVPCHGDLHAGNVVVGANGSLKIVDWDDPVLAPRERDLMFVGAGIGGAWNRGEESAAFFRGYGAVTVNAEALAYYRCERIVEDIAVFCDQLLIDRGDEVAEREQRLRKLVTIFDPNDVVEIAERSFAALWRAQPPTASQLSARPMTLAPDGSRPPETARVQLAMAAPPSWPDNSPTVFRNDKGRHDGALHLQTSNWMRRYAARRSAATCASSAASARAATPATVRRADFGRCPAI